MYEVIGLKESEKHSKSRRHHYSCVMGSRTESIDGYPIRVI